MAVDGDRLAAHHPGGVRGEEEAQVGDLVGLHEARDRLALDILTLNGDPRAAASRRMTSRMRSPSTEPGQIALARTPEGPSSMASDFVRPMTAHLAAAYGDRMPMPYCPAVDEMLMIDPSRAAFIAGITRAHVR